MREKFHRITNEINDLAKIKFECDDIAHQHTKHVALGGFGVLVVYWGSIYYLTFQKYGWDIMEPITYLTGLGTAMGISPAPPSDSLPWRYLKRITYSGVPVVPLPQQRRFLPLRVPTD
jgi:hypothetical protein